MKKFSLSIPTVVKRCLVIITICTAISVFNSCAEKSSEQPDDRPVSAGTIKGKVSDASSGAPIPYASVMLFPDKTYLQANSSGEFRFDDIEAGEYTVGSLADGYEYAEATVHVSAGGTANCTIYLERETTPEQPDDKPVSTGTINGKVLDASSNTPISNAFVMLFPDETYLYSNGSGEFRFSDIKAGEYSVSSVADGYESANVKVYVSAGASADCTIYMERETNPQPTEDYSSAKITWDLPDLEVELISCKRKSGNVELVYTMTNTDMLRNQSVTVNNVNAFTNHTHIADNLGNQYPRDQVKISLAGRDYGYANNTDGMLLGGIPAKVVVTVKAVDAGATEMHYYIYTSTAKAGGMNYASDITFRDVKIY